VRRRHFVILALVSCLGAAAQESRFPASSESAGLNGPIIRTNFIGDVPAAPAAKSAALELPPLDNSDALMTVAPPVTPMIPALPEPQFEVRPRGVDWTGVSAQSFFFLGVQHATRLVQTKTRRELKGKFFDEWANAVSGLDGWGDGDSMLTNYVGHPMMGAITGWVFIQNDPNGIGKDFDARDMKYWNSRLRAMGWAAIYSTQFELGPVSESTIGHVGKKRGTAGAVDLVMTPIGGLGWIVAEDAVDKHLIMKLEDGSSDGLKRFVRIVLNPNRAVANVLRLKKPWHRDTRPMSWDQ
jgi:hypothetical protein